MTERTYYIGIDGGHRDNSITKLRKLAMEHLLTNPDCGSVTIYTSPTMRVVVGTVRLNGTGFPLFSWILPRGRTYMLYPNGSVYKNLN